MGSTAKPGNPVTVSLVTRALSIGFFVAVIAFASASFPLPASSSSPALPVQTQRRVGLPIPIPRAQASPVVIAPTVPALPPGTINVAYPPAQFTGNGGAPPYAWSVSAGALPPGLTLNPASGIVSGTPSATGTYQFTVRLTDSQGATATTGQLNLTINPPPVTIVQTGLPNGSVNIGYPATTLMATGGTPPYSWSIASGSLPPGLTLASAGSIGGTPTAAGNYAVTIRVSDSNGQSATAPFQIVVNASPINITQPLPPGTVNSSYLVALTAVGGTPPYNWTVIAGSLPTGLSLSTSGTISGTPSAAGSSAFTVKATDANGQPAVTQLVITVVKGSSIAIPPIAIPDTPLNTPIQITLAVSGGVGPYTWRPGACTLPPGVTLSPTGVLSGTPGAAGSYSCAVTVTDATGASAGTQFLFTVLAPALAVTTANLPGGTVGVVYQPVTLAAIGGALPYTWARVSGTLPPGLTLFSSGVIGGLPTSEGTFNFVVQVADSAGASSAMALTLIISRPLAIQTASPLTGAVIGMPYSQTLTAIGGIAPYTFVLQGTPPPGLTLSAAGLLSGTPTAGGIFTFAAAVTDSAQTNVTSPFQLTVASLVPPLLVSPLSLSFGVPTGGDSPALQSLMLLTTTGAPVSFTVQIDAGTANSAAPRWLNVTPMNGTTPGRLVVSADPDGMAAGSYAARIRIVIPSSTTSVPIDVPVTLTVALPAPQLDIVPAFVRLAASVQAPTGLEQVIVVRNTGGGSPVNFSTSIVGQSAWITDVTPASGQTVQNSPIFVRVHINTQGLQVGSYRDVIHVASSSGDLDIPVSLFVAGGGPILGLNVTGVRFRIKQGNGTTQSQTVNVLNLGDPAAATNLSVDLLSGSEWLSVTTNANRLAPPRAGILMLLPNANAAGLAAGAYYALVRVTDPQALNSPQYLTAVLEVADAQSPAVLEPSPAGLFFTAAAGGPAPSGQPVRVFTSNADPVPFQVSADTRDGATWLIATPSALQATTLSPGQIAVTVNPAGLKAGIYMGHVNIAFAGSMRAVNVTLVVTPAASASAIRAAQGCTPARLAITQTGLPDSFAVPAKWPANLIVQVNDDCATPVLNGSVVASFSNGDAPLTLRGDRSTGTYSATWQPGAVSPQMTVTVRAVAGSLQPAVAQLVGGITPNRAPVLAKNGTVNALNRVPAAPVAPSTIVEVYGSDLASLTTTLNTLPLPTISSGTFYLVGPVQTPLYFLSNGQLNAQIPAELASNKQYAMVVSANGALTLPETIDVVPVQPGVAATPDGHVIAQHADFSLVDTAHPVKPGEILIIYLSGMGATNPGVASGSASPGVEPLARLTLQPVVKVNGQNAEIVFAGLTPGLVGLYQINLRVPVNLTTGDSDLVVSQGEVTSNTTKLPVVQ